MAAQWQDGPHLPPPVPRPPRPPGRGRRFSTCLMNNLLGRKVRSGRRLKVRTACMVVLSRPRVHRWATMMLLVCMARCMSLAGASAPRPTPPLGQPVAPGPAGSGKLASAP
eukprot:14402857-Alexandrium_andersonii.AAC.1